MDATSLIEALQTKLHEMGMAIRNLEQEAAPIFELENAKTIAEVDYLSFGILGNWLESLMASTKKFRLKAAELDMYVQLGLIGNEDSSLSKAAVSENYEDKKFIARSLNQYLRQCGGAIAGEVSGYSGIADPCVIYAISSRDKAGRYVLESMVTKDRGRSYRSIKEMLPLKLMPRITTEEAKELLAERVRKQEHSDAIIDEMLDESEEDKKE